MPTIAARHRELSLSLASLCLIAACYGLARFAYGLFVPAFRDAFGVGSTATGVVAAGGYVVYCMAVLAASMLTPRLGGRVVAVAAGVLATAGTLTIAVAPNAAVLVVGVLLGGASTGLVSPALAHAVTHAVEESRQGRTQTVVNAGTGVGVAVAGPVALLTHEHWRAAWLVFAVLAAAATAWAACVVPADRSTGRRPLLPRPLFPPGSRRLTVAAALAGAASAAVWTFGRDLMTSVGDLGERASIVAWVALGALGVAGALAGDAAARLGSRSAWSATALLLGGATAALALAPGDVVVATASAGVFGAAYIALSGLLLLWGAHVHAETPAAGVGWAFLVLALGQAAGSAVLGAVAEAGSMRWAFGLAAALALAAATTRPSGHARRPAALGRGAA
ncbi:MFS transporter [Aeromicrobium sp. 179-A 4D2 NHS]|uniref:MFS transporter n=1 Tax=Aeromicrobium sp. 179-A 4D2 NHS TaxID=3142375 RepID=UPI0039A1E38D